jgi:hypothetical protein
LILPPRRPSRTGSNTGVEASPGVVLSATEDPVAEFVNLAEDICAAFLRAKLPVVAARENTSEPASGSVTTGLRLGRDVGVGSALARYSALLADPGAEVDQPTALAAERAPRRRVRPLDGPIAGRAGNDRRRHRGITCRSTA